MIESLKFEWFYFLCAYRTQGVSPEDSKILVGRTFWHDYIKQYYCI